MKPIVLITGANGMLAKYLANDLSANYPIRFLTRNPKKANEYLWDIENNFIDTKALMGVDHIIHLAGASVAEKRWTNKRRKVIYSSRINSAQLIMRELEKNKLTIKTFISASAVGYYGTTTTNNILTEESPKGNDFLSDVCHQWENAAHKFKTNNIADRIAILRIGIILQKNDGALKKMALPIKFGIGSVLGTGEQFVPWIHIEDLSQLFKFTIENDKLNGVFNAVAPEYTSNNTLTKEIARQLHRKIILPKTPKFILRLIFGEMAIILLEGSRVSSEKRSTAGFKFKYNNLKDAISNVID